MLIGCTLPLLLLFSAPALGISEDIGIFLFILVMFACHLLMPHGHGKHKHQDQNTGAKEELYERHTH